MNADPRDNKDTFDSLTLAPLLPTLLVGPPSDPLRPGSPGWHPSMLSLATRPAPNGKSRGTRNRAAESPLKNSPPAKIDLEEIRRTGKGNCGKHGQQQGAGPSLEPQRATGPQHDAALPKIHQDGLASSSSSTTAHDQHRRGAGGGPPRPSTSPHSMISVEPAQHGRSTDRIPESELNRAADLFAERDTFAERELGGITSLLAQYEEELCGLRQQLDTALRRADELDRSHARGTPGTTSTKGGGGGNFSVQSTSTRTCPLDGGMSIDDFGGRPSTSSLEHDFVDRSRLESSAPTVKLQSARNGLAQLLQPISRGLQQQVAGFKVQKNRILIAFIKKQKQAFQHCVKTKKENVRLREEISFLKQRKGAVDKDIQQLQQAVASKELENGNLEKQ